MRECVRCAVYNGADGQIKEGKQKTGVGTICDEMNKEIKFTYMYISFLYATMRATLGLGNVCVVQIIPDTLRGYAPAYAQAPLCSFAF